MSLVGHEAVVVRSGEAETLSLLGGRARLLADSSATGGALSTLRVTLGRGPTAPPRTATAGPRSCSSSSTARRSCWSARRW